MLCLKEMIICYQVPATTQCTDGADRKMGDKKKKMLLHHCKEMVQHQDRAHTKRLILIINVGIGCIMRRARRAQSRRR